MTQIVGDAPGTNRRDLIIETLATSQRESARFMNVIRCGLLAGFVVLYAVGIVVLDTPGFRSSLWLLLAYCTVAGLLWFFGRREGRILNCSRFAVPLLDMPMVAVIQHCNLPATYPELTAIFTLAVLGLLTALSSFSMRARNVFVSACIGLACLFTIYSRCGELTVLSWLAAPLILFSTAAMMSFLPHRQLRLIRDAAEKQARRDRLARYFSPGVAEVIESHDEAGNGEACELSVLFCDIRSFTSLSESMDAGDVVRLLNEFHGHMVEAIFRFGGTLDKYLGDGLLAYFNAPVRQDDHARRAVGCALAMVEALAGMNATREQDGREPIRIGIGVHSGQAIVGNIGADHRREFTAIGNTVNVCSRIESLTKDHGTPILVSDSVVSGCRNVRDFHFKPMGEVEVRGREAPLTILAPSNAA